MNVHTETLAQNLFTRGVVSIKLTKPGIVVSNAMMAGVGVLVSPNPGPLLATLVGTSLLVAGCGAANMGLEMDVDALMSRTQSRPVAKGQISENFAASLAVICLILGSLILALATTVTAALLGVLAALIYIGIYTPMKRIHWLAIPVGAIAGALPPLIGWTATGAQLSATPILLVACIFVWQLPHFLSISVRRGQEYVDAGLAIGCPPTSRAMVVTLSRGLSVALALITLPLTWLVHPFFFLAFLIAGVQLAVSLMPANEPMKWAKRVFFSGLLYLPVLAASSALSILFY